MTPPALPPLVAPGPPLTPAQRSRYSRQLALPALGEAGQRRLLAARVLVVGAGGLGSPVLLYLAAAGVGTIGIVDDDAVHVSNLHRQIAHSEADEDRSKVDSAAESLRRIDPSLEVVPHRVRLDAGNAAALLTGYDLVVDGSDTFATRYAVSDAAAAAGIPHVWGSALRGDGQVSVFWSAPPQREPVTLRDLFPAAGEDADTCETDGVLGPLCGVVGSLMAAEAIKLITGSGVPLLGRVLVVDALDATVTEVPFRPAQRTTAARPPAPAAVPTPAPIPVPPAVPTVEHAQALALADAGALLVDVREPHEVAPPPLPGSRRIPSGQLLGDAAPLPGVPKDAAIVVCCQTGRRSAAVTRHLRDAGFSGAVSLAGGLAGEAP